MKIAIPTSEGRLCPHFGHCEEFTFVEVDPEAKSVVSVQAMTPPPHEPGVLPNWIGDQGANLVIAGGMGGHAQNLLLERGVKVLLGAPPAPVADVLTAYLAGTLLTGANLCDH